MRPLFVFIIVCILATSGCMSNELDNETDSSLNALGSEDEYGNDDIMDLGLRDLNFAASYNITNREGEEVRSRAQSEYIIESGKVRMIKSGSETQYWPPSSRDESNVTIICGETCDIDSTGTVYSTGPVLNPDLENSTNTGSKEVGGNECEIHSLSEISDTDEHYTGTFFSDRGTDVTHCIGDKGVIYESTVTKDGVSEYESRSELIEYNDLDSQEVEERLEIPEVAISGSINRVCDSNEFDIAATRDLENIELVILDPEEPGDAESLDDLESIDSTTIDIEESWKKQTKNFEVDEDRFIIAPVINGEILEKGSFGCIY